jgi:ribosomal-protein-alanine N-acetyltransferase
VGLQPTLRSTKEKARQVVSYRFSMVSLILETERLRLRPFRLEDRDELFAVLGDAETMRYYPEPFTSEGTLDWIHDNLRRYRQDGFGLWAMDLKETGELVGDCGPAVREVDGVAEIELGWHVRRAFWGQGLATEAAVACRDWVFRNIRPSRLIALVRPDNGQSCRVAEKIGMTVEGEVEYGSMSWLHLVYAIHPPGHRARALAGNREGQKENLADGSTLK